jgi:uncharacterized iron-regulated membrane protein
MCARAFIPVRIPVRLLMFQRFRKLLFWIHLVAGVVAAVVILLMAITGVLLSFERQLTARADGFQLESPGDAQRMGIEELYGAARDAGLKGVSGITVPSDLSQPVAIQVGRERIVFLDPKEGRWLGEGGKKTRAFFQFVTGLHRWLAMQGEAQNAGKNITASAALVFVFLIVSGLVLWIPKRWTRQGVKVITTIQPQLKGRARDWNWHNVFGIWFAVPLLVIASTGIVIGFPWANALVFRLAGEAPPSGGKGGRPGGPPAAVATTGWNQAYAAVTSNRSGWETIQFQVPAGKEMVFQIFNSHRGRPDLKESVTVDLATAAIVKSESFSDMSKGKRWRNWIRWVHTGEAGGWAGQLLAALSAMAAALLVWTGLALSWRRWRKSRGAKA